MRKIGELKGKPIIEGNPNEIKKNQIHYKEFDGNITLSERKEDNTLSSVTSGSGGGEGVKEYYYKVKDTAVINAIPSACTLSHITGIIESHSGKFIENSQTFAIINNIMGTMQSQIIQFYAFKYIDIEVYDISLHGNEYIIGKSGLGNLNERLYTMVIINETGSEVLYNECKEAFDLSFEEITKEEYEAMITYKPE